MKFQQDAEELAYGPTRRSGVSGLEAGGGDAGRGGPSGKMFFAIDLEERARPEHPLRAIKATVDRILAGMSDSFAAADGDTGRPSVPPERLLEALLLTAQNSVRSERQPAERGDTDLLSLVPGDGPGRGRP